MKKTELAERELRLEDEPIEELPTIEGGIFTIPRI